MTPLWISVSILTSVGLASSQQAPPAPINEPPPVAPRGGGMIEVNRIAATANARPITTKELSVLLGPEVARLMAEYPRRGPEFEKQLITSRDQILQELIDRELIMSEFKEMEKKGANLSDQAVDDEIERQVREIYNNDTQKLRDELSKVRMSMKAYKDMTREKLIVQAMRSEKFKDAPPPLPGEVRKEYNDSKDLLRDTTKDSLDYRKIFIPRIDPTNPLATPETQLALAESLAEELKLGADFAEMAKAQSADAFAEDGGLQTEIDRESLSPEFAAILFESKPGTILGPLESPEGFTIARVEELRKGPAPPFDDVKEVLEARVRAKKTSSRYEAWIKKLRDEAMIDIKIK